MPALCPPAAKTAPQLPGSTLDRLLAELRGLETLLPGQARLPRTGA